MSILNGHRVGKWYGADEIFDGVSFMVNRGDKVALVGPNGAGKSTLLKIVAGIEDATKGSVGRARGLRLAYLAQEAHFEDGGRLIDAARGAFSHLEAMEAELRELEPLMADTDHPEWEARMERYGDLHARFEHAGGFHTENVIGRTLEGLGFRREHFDQDLGTFSGGQKTRAALAITLLQDPDVLLLDEPTNHLDLRALQWLEGFLKDWPGTLVVISHDRYFLDKVTTRTWEMAFGRLEDYPGNYPKFVQLKAEKLERQQKQYEASQEFIAKTEEFIRRFKAGQRSKEAKGREKRLQTYKYGRTGVNNTFIPPRAVDAPQRQKALKLALDAGLRSGEVTLTIGEGLRAGYKTPAGDKVLVQTPPLVLRRGECIALMGPNGAGKTTLLRTITGELPALAGRLELGVNVSVGYYAQVHDELIPTNTVLEEVHRLKPLEKTERIRTLLGRFLFGDDIYKHVGDLSGGERSRVALAQLTLKAPNLLLLDEPTNHLDIDAREALESVLMEFPGSILFVSHDRYFVDALADKLRIVEDGTVKEFEGDYSEYAAHLAAEEAARRKAATAAAPKEQQANGNGRGPAADGRAAKAREKRLEAIEREIAELEARKEAIAADINSASRREDVAAVTRLGQAYGEIEEVLLDKYDTWAAAAAEVAGA